MTEPIPSASQHADGDAAGEHQLPANAEDRKAAAALSSLNENDISQAGAEGASALPSAADQEALGKAMSRLEIVAGGGGATKKDGGKKTEGAAAKKEEVAVKKKAVKVAPEDVELLVKELDLSKPKATELLKSHNGDAVQALHAYIAPPTATATATAA